ncbi:hypothetical protein BDW62DRAFT_37266 [Aspergillus aurantiobrunneus]
MGKPFLSVAIYRPRHGNFQHWALHLHTDFEYLIYEADGEHPSFIKATSVGNPTDNKSFIGSFYVGEIGIADIATAKRIVDEARVDNEWDCQDYVLEILEACEREAVLDEEDLDYAEVKEIPRQKRGPML